MLYHSPVVRNPIKTERQAMSHVDVIDFPITDLSVLGSAAQRLGMEMRKQNTYRWFGEHVGDHPLPKGFTQHDLGRCEYALTIPGDERAYEVGVVKRRDGQPGYALIYDFYQGGYGLVTAVGKECSKLTQAYKVVTAKRAALREGFAVREVVKQDGTVRLTLKN